MAPPHASLPDPFSNQSDIYETIYGLINYNKYYVLNNAAGGGAIFISSGLFITKGFKRGYPLYYDLMFYILFLQK